jgi:hypothetical protein
MQAGICFLGPLCIILMPVEVLHLDKEQLIVTLNYAGITGSCISLFYLYPYMFGPKLIDDAKYNNIYLYIAFASIIEGLALAIYSRILIPGNNWVMQSICYTLFLNGFIGMLIRVIKRAK